MREEEEEEEEKRKGKRGFVIPVRLGMKLAHDVLILERIASGRREYMSTYSRYVHIGGLQGKIQTL